MFIVTVSLQVETEYIEQFLSLMQENANASLQLEPACEQFDVCVDPSALEKIFLYEVYENKAAFEKHLSMSHFKSFDAATRDMVRSKSVQSFVRLDFAL